jgi:hypothetical protein
MGGGFYKMSSEYEKERLEKELQFVERLFSEQKDITLVLESKDEEHRGSIKMLIYILAKIYLRADWSKIGRNSRAEDVFQHKIRVAASQRSVIEIIECLANKLGLQSIAVLSKVFDVLIEDSDYLKNLLRHSGGGIFLSRKSMELAIIIKKKNIEEAKKNGSHKN